MIAFSIALVLVAYIGAEAFRLYVKVRYPAPPDENKGELTAKVEGLSGRVETLELQRGILRNVKGTKP